MSRLWSRDFSSHCPPKASFASLLQSFHTARLLLGSHPQSPKPLEHGGAAVGANAETTGHGIRGLDGLDGEGGATCCNIRSSGPWPPAKCSCKCCCCAAPVEKAQGPLPSPHPCISRWRHVASRSAVVAVSQLLVRTDTVCVSSGRAWRGNVFLSWLCLRHGLEIDYLGAA